MVREISSTNWANPADLECVLPMLLESKGQGVSATPNQQRRASMQDCTQLHGVLPGSLWGLITGKQACVDFKMQRLDQHAATLGLAWPSEKTSQHAAALFCVVAHLVCPDPWDGTRTVWTS